MRYLVLGEVFALYKQIMTQSGGALGIRDLNALESAIMQPRATFGSQDLYPTIVEKATTLGFSLIQNHPFLDGNKRTSHAAMETFLVLNGFEINASVNEQEQIVVQIASSKMSRQQFTDWLRDHLIEHKMA
ncbi:MAG: death-on-curing protein [Beggiatoa sp. IS2]|nr:MAG: death-on-curing protein [Beggiatoa sp. IS2]